MSVKLFPLSELTMHITTLCTTATPTWGGQRVGTLPPPYGADPKVINLVSDTETAFMY